MKINNIKFITKKVNRLGDLTSDFNNFRNFNSVPKKKTLTHTQK